MTTAIPAHAQEQEYNSGLPEVEIDGSVLKALDPSAGATQTLKPIKLIPPSDRPYASLTAAEPEDDKIVAAPTPVIPTAKPEVISEKKIVMPDDAPIVQKEIPTPVAIIAPAPKPVIAAKKIQTPVKKEIAKVEPAPETRPVSVSTASAGKVVSKPVELTDDNKRPAVKPKPVAVKKDPVPEPKMIVKVEDVLTPLPVIAEPPPLVAAIKPAPAPKPVVAPVAVSAPVVKNSGDITAPPDSMKETANLKAPVGRSVLFPIKSTSKTTGEFNPSLKSGDVTAVAPIAAQPDTSNAINQTMAVRDPVPAPRADDWRQDQPEEIYSDVPLPKKRPNVTMASKEFVENARRVYQDTYTVMKRDGASMPAIQRQKVVAEKLPPGRLSVADIASDPLASQLVSMSPDDVAAALNNIAPASGEETRTLTGGRPRPKIVRENGNWLERHKPLPSPTGGEQTASVEATAPVNLAPADGRYTIGFKAGETDLPVTAPGEIDSGIVPVLKADNAARVQIVAFSSATDGNEASARRTSLSRALALRSYLISKGIDATRMDVRAMGVQQDAKAAPDQVDMIVLQAKKS